MRKKILFICGSPNQTSMMHQISKHLGHHELAFTPYYCDGFFRVAQRYGLLDFTIIGGQNRENTETYLNRNALPVDYAGLSQDYDLYLTCTDLMVQRNLKGKRVVLVQEGMTDPENFMYHVTRRLQPLGFPRWMGSTATTGLSDAYDKFCVASEGYRDHFVRKGVKPQKIEVTGIPNFDNCKEYLNNDFPHHGYVLACTTDTRENFKWDARRRFIERVLDIAAGRQIIFRLHPNENTARSAGEINELAPGALIFQKGNTNHMIANCDVLVTQYSSVSYVGLALNKEVYSYFDMRSLKRMLPIQNDGSSGANIARVCEELIQ